MRKPLTLADVGAACISGGVIGIFIMPTPKRGTNWFAVISTIIFCCGFALLIISSINYLRNRHRAKLEARPGFEIIQTPTPPTPPPDSLIPQPQTLNPPPPH